MSKLCSNNLVAVTVDQAMTNTQNIIPSGFINSTKIEVAAKKTKGKSEYPKMLIVVYNSR